MACAHQKNFSIDDPEPICCRKCDGLGRRGFDGCSVCEGTGSVFYVRGETFPNTILGFMQAKTAKETNNHD